MPLMAVGIYDSVAFIGLKVNGSFLTALILLKKLIRHRRPGSRPESRLDRRPERSCRQQTVSQSVLT